MEIAAVNLASGFVNYRPQADKTSFGKSTAFGRESGPKVEAWRGWQSGLGKLGPMS